LVCGSFLTAAIDATAANGSGFENALIERSISPRANSKRLMGSLGNGHLLRPPADTYLIHHETSTPMPQIIELAWTCTAW
jgi:hypothetical protein